MHRLYESVCPMVEEATRAEEDPAVTFVRVRKLAGPTEGQFGPLQEERAGV
jgi:hypothetical protein